MIHNLLAGLAILKPGPNIVIEVSRIVCAYNEYVTSLDKAWLEAHHWLFDHENGVWYYNPSFTRLRDAEEFERRAKEFVNSFKALDLNW